MIKTDYLIVGTGAVGMAFADVLVAETDADIVMVDRYPAPGGHWNEAYPFVTLHQPSAYYGVNSRELSTGSRDVVGLNRGLADLASGAEVMAYYDRVMRETLLPSGRVRYFPMSDYNGGAFTSRLTGERVEVEADTHVDATWLKTTIPATHTPNFEIAEGVRFIPPNDLMRVDAAERFVVIGGGKTGIDTVLWLLEAGVGAERIQWIVSRDAWLLDRENTQNHPDFFQAAMGAQAGQFEAIAGADSPKDMFARLEACGYFLRLDETVEPEMFHGATISQAEVAALRQVGDVVRMGRVRRVGLDKIELDGGEVATTPTTVHVDCSASALKQREAIPVFQGDRITPQMVRAYQPAFSAAFIAHVEARGGSEADKNALCRVVPLPDTLEDYMRLTRANMMNQYVWGQDRDLRAWMRESRLDGFSGMLAGVKGDADKEAVMGRLQAAAMPAMGKLNAFLGI